MEQFPARENELAVKTFVQTAGVTQETAREILAIVRVSETMKFPSAVMVGGDLVLVPNEACYALEAGKHLGRSVGRCCDVWPQFWSRLGAQCRHVFESGTPQSMQDVAIAAAETEEECFF